VGAASSEANRGRLQCLIECTLTPSKYTKFENSLTVILIAFPQENFLDRAVIPMAIIPS